jgi:hypothetical protein
VFSVVEFLTILANKGGGKMRKWISVSMLLWAGIAQGMHLDVVDLRGTSEEERLLTLSLQGNVNRDSARLYVVWEDAWSYITALPLTPSERWLEYYESKAWITHDSVSLDSALSKYKGEVKGYVIYDPNFRQSINVAFTVAGIESSLVAHPDYISQLSGLGIPEIMDLRGRWTDKIEMYTWQRDTLFQYCNKSMIAAMTIHPLLWYESGHPMKDYAVANRACVVDLCPDTAVTEEYNLLKTYYEQIDSFGLVLGWPAVYTDPFYELWHVHLASQHNLMLMHERYDGVNFSVHSEIPADTIYNQPHSSTVSLDTTKVYCTFTLIDGGSMMQNRWYNAWDDPARGSIPINWYFEPVFRNWCPGIYQHYYETRTANDYFIGAFGMGYIFPSDFPLLSQYLDQSKQRLRDCDLRALALINGFRMDDKMISAYTSTLDDLLGFCHGYSGTEFGWINTANYRFEGGMPYIITAPLATITMDSAVGLLDSVVKGFHERPLFLCPGVHLYCFNVDSVRRIMDRLDVLHPGEFKFVKADEFMLALRAYGNLLDASRHSCDSLDLTYGTLVSGDKDSLSSDDGQCLVINSNWWFNYCTEFRTFYNVDQPRDSIKRIWITYDGHCSEDSAYNYLYLWNNSISDWDQIGWRTMTAQDFTQEDGVTHNVQDYVSGNNQIGVRVLTSHKLEFTGYADYLKVETFRKREVGIEESNGQSPMGNWQLSIHPNPATHNCVVEFGVRGSQPEADEPLAQEFVDQKPVSLNIYDLSGRVVRSFQISKSPNHQIIRLSWDGRNDAGKLVSSGIYFVKLKAGNEFSKTNKLLFLK